MRRKEIPDERIAAQQSKINSECFSLLVLGLLISMMIQQFVMDAPFKQYAAEFICFFAVSLYIIARNLMLGLNLYGNSKRPMYLCIITSLIVGITVTVISGYSNYHNYSEHFQNDNFIYFLGSLAVTFISSTLSSLVLMFFLIYLNKKKQANIQKKLDEQEKED
jgi:predicted neutral ceramidase superfamily lipid hydrolase